MVDLALGALPAAAATVALLATRPTAQARIYQGALERAGKHVLDGEAWQVRIDALILAIKSSADRSAARALWQDLIADLYAAGADTLLLACTDLNAVSAAADTPLVLIGSQLSTGGSGILVSKDSPIQTVADLKGKKVAYTVGSSANYLTIQALKTVGLQLTDIQPQNLQPGDARAAFEGGSIDAWTIWDPYQTIALAGGNARSIFDSSQLPPTRGYQEASVAFAHDHSDAIEIVLQQYQKAIEWARSNPDDYAAYLEQETSVPAATWKTIYTQTPPADLEYITPAIVAQEQSVADTFFQLNLIPKALDISAAAWDPAGFVPPTAEATASPTAESTSSS